MTKFLWYTYFGLYLVFTSITGKIKLFFLKRFSPSSVDKYAHKKVQSIANHVLKKSKTTTILEGMDNIPDGPCVFISNHQAIFDGFLFLANIDKITGFIAKKEIKKLPLIRSWLSSIHSVYIDRQNVREGIKAINNGIENIKNGYSMIIFPEGTRSLSSEMGKFKKGSMKLAIKAKVPIVPVTVDGTYRVLEVGNIVTGHTVKMTIHKPIYLEKLSEEEKKNLSDIVRDTIKSGL